MHLGAHVGRCARQDKCTYHFTPKQFFDEKGQPPVARKKPGKILYEQGCIATADWQNTLRCYNQNNFVLHLAHLLGKAGVEAAKRYHVGTSRHWQGATIFWQLDARGICRTGKIMLFDETTCKRVKEPFNHICWVHSLKDKLKQPLYPDYHLKQCLFGEHLLTPEVRDVALVESEKTAIIASHFYQDKIWLATGGKEGLTKERCGILRDKNVFIYPDVGSEDKWAEAAKQLFPSHSIMPLHDEESGVDIADVLCRRVNTVV